MSTSKDRLIQTLERRPCLQSNLQRRAVNYTQQQDVCLFPNFRGMLLLEKSQIIPNNLLKDMKPIFPGSPQSKISLSCAAFPGLSIPPIWQGVDGESVTHGFGPWLLPFTSCVALNESPGSSEPWPQYV